jgi:hypothetical protein
VLTVLMGVLIFWSPRSCGGPPGGSEMMERIADVQRWKEQANTAR